MMMTGTALLQTPKAESPATSRCILSAFQLRKHPLKAVALSEDELAGLPYPQRKVLRRALRQKVLIEQKSEELGIPAVTVERMLRKGWSLEKTLQWQDHKFMIQQERWRGFQQEALLIEHWIEQREPLIRWGLSNRWSARLQAGEKYQWKWSDLQTWQPKLEVLALFPHASYSQWNGLFRIDPEVRDQKLKAQERRRNRFEVLPLFWIEAAQRQELCRLTFLNGVQVSGFPLWFNKYAVALAPTPESVEPGMLAFFHGLASAEKLSKHVHA